MSNKTVKKKNKKKDRDKKKILFFILKATIGIMILSGFLYFFVIPPRFNVVEKVAPEELVYEEMVLTVRTNKPLKLLSLDENWLDNYMQNYVYKNYHLDPTIYDFSYEQKGSEYIAKLTPKYNNMHEECYMTEFKDADMDIEDYVMAFLIQSRAKFVLDIKGNKEDFSEVLRTGGGVDYQYATMFWMLLQEKGIKSTIEYIDGIYYNVVQGKKFDIGNNIYH